MSHRRRIAIVAALAVGAHAGGTEPLQDDALLERLTAAAERSVEEFELPGMAVGMAVGDELLFAMPTGSSATASVVSSTRACSAPGRSRSN